MPDSFKLSSSSRRFSYGRHKFQAVPLFILGALTALFLMIVFPIQIYGQQNDGQDLNFKGNPSVLAAGSTRNGSVEANESGTNFFQSLLIYLAGGIVLLGMGGGGYFLYGRSRKKGSLDRDKLRKSDLERIKEGLSAFYKMQGRYPDKNKGEYQQVLESINPLAADPKEGRATGFKTNVYGYYYDNLPPGSKDQGAKDLNYYRLWCYLENSSDPEAKQYWENGSRGVYLLTSPSYKEDDLPDEEFVDRQGFTSDQSPPGSKDGSSTEDSTFIGKIGIRSKLEKSILYFLLSFFILAFMVLITLDVLILVNIF